MKLEGRTAIVVGGGRNAGRAICVGLAREGANVAVIVRTNREEAEESAGLVRAAGGKSLVVLADVRSYADAVPTFALTGKRIRALPLDRISTVHIAGGTDAVDMATGTTLRVDDHRHDVPAEVFELLTLVGALAPQPLTVVLERDGDFPPFEQLLEELELARTALAAGRRAPSPRSA